MFTGIIEALGTIESVKKGKHSTRVSISHPFRSSEIRIGESIASDGCCLTVVEKKAKSYSVDISPETLEQTNLGSWKKGRKINLERSLKVGDRLGGHIVQGHVDALSQLLKKEKIRDGASYYYRLTYALPKKIKAYLVKKGSVAIDGISLTVNEVKAKSFSVCIIPHTAQETNIALKTLNESVNIETDILARYLDRFMQVKED